MGHGKKLWETLGSLCKVAARSLNFIWDENQVNKRTTYKRCRYTYGNIKKLLLICKVLIVSSFPLMFSTNGDHFQSSQHFSENEGLVCFGEEGSYRIVTNISSRKKFFNGASRVLLRGNA